jgi:hypothetical protein
MSSSHHTNDTHGMAIGVIEENQEFIKRILRPYAESTSSRGSKPPYTGPNRRGMSIVTVEQIAERLAVDPADIVGMAKLNYIPGAYQNDDEWYFDGRHLRIWYDDFQMGIISIPHWVRHVTGWAIEWQGEKDSTVDSSRVAMSPAHHAMDSSRVAMSTAHRAVA